MHAVTNDGTKTYTYDANGNMLAGSNGEYLGWDGDGVYENRVTLSVTTGPITTTYTYDGDGNRVKKVVGAATTYYVGNYYEVDNGTQVKYYYFDSKRIAVNRGGTRSYLASDHPSAALRTGLDSTSVWTNSNGVEGGNQQYYAYGANRAGSGDTPTDYQFTGQRRDFSSNLYQMGARWYDPSLNRWVQPDTIVPDWYNPQTLNRFAYTYNNPVRYYDSDGHCFPFCIVLPVALLRNIPRGYVGAGARFVADLGIPGVSDFAALDVNSADAAWLLANADKLRLSKEQALSIAKSGYDSLVTEAFIIYAVGLGATSLRGPNQGVQPSLPAAQRASSTGVKVLDSVSKTDAKAAIRGGIEGLTKEQSASLLDKLDKGRIDKFTVQIMDNGIVRATAERGGAEGGFQRLIWEYDPSGEIVSFLQEAYDDLGVLIHVHDKLDDVIP